MVDKIDAVFDRTITAREQARFELFHKPEKAFTRLRLSDVQTGQRVLDIGSGKNELVKLLRHKGVAAVGVDFAPVGKELPQKADATVDSMKLAFGDDTFDMVVSHFGGLHYPLLDIFVVKGKIEAEKKIARVLMRQLLEGVRVSKDKVRVAPWSVTPFFEEYGVLALPYPGRDLAMFLFDFRSLFSKLGIKWNPQSGEPEADSNIRFGTYSKALFLEGCGGQNVAELTEQIDTMLLERTSSPFWYLSDILKRDKERYKVVDDMLYSLGRVFEYRLRIRDLETAILGGKLKKAPFYGGEIEMVSRYLPQKNVRLMSDLEFVQARISLYENAVKANKKIYQAKRRNFRQSEWPEVNTTLMRIK